MYNDLRRAFEASGITEEQFQRFVEFTRNTPGCGLEWGNPENPEDQGFEARPIVFALLPSGLLKEAEERVDILTTEANALTDRVDDLEQELEYREECKEDMEEDIRRKEAIISELEAEIDALNQELATVGEAHAEVLTDYAELESTFAEYRERMER